MLRSSLGGGALVLASLATAQAPAPLPAISGPVVVTGNPSARPAEQLPFSTSVLVRRDIEAAGPLSGLADVLARVPGIAAAPRNNLAQDVQLSSRGFGARAGFGIRGLRLYDDGIPATSPDGQGQAAHIDLDDAQRIEILRGPFSSLYGNASGGVIAVEHGGPQQDELAASVRAGAFGLRQYALNGALGADGRGLRGGASRLALDGFRPHSSAQRTLLSVNGAAADSALKARASYWQQDAQDPLGLTRSQFSADPRQTAPEASQYDTRKDAQQAQAGFAWNGEPAVVTVYAGERAVKQWLAIPAAVQANPKHSGGVVDFERTYGGADGRHTFRFEAVDVTVGLAGDVQLEDRRGYENFIGAQPGVTGALRREEDNRAWNVDEYLQAAWTPSSRWTVSAGARHGDIAFRSQDHYLANGDDSGDVSYSYVAPVAGVTYTPAPSWTWRASAGRGFETPTFNELSYRPDGSSGMNRALKAQSSRQLEAGLTKRFASAGLDIAVFTADTKDELVVLTNAGGRSSFGNGGRSARQGGELGAHWAIADTVRTQLAVTWLDARYRDGFLSCVGVPAPCTTPSRFIPAGNALPGVPQWSSFAELAWQADPRLELALEWRARSKVPVNDSNTDDAAGYGAVALRGRRDVAFDEFTLELGLRLDNVLDRAYAGSVIVNEANGRYFEPGAPRSLLATVALLR